MLYFWMWELTRDLREKNHNLYHFLLLEHFERAHVQVAVDCLIFRQAKLPKESQRKYKDVICKDWENPSDLFAEVHVHPLASRQTRRKNVNLIILGEALSLFWG